jgi:hypothetical protein
MKINFQLTQNYALNFDNRYIDLHNNFNFINLEYNVETMALVLRWVRSSSNWVKEDELLSLELLHKNLSYLIVSSRDPEMPLSEDSCLSNITFFASSSRDINDRIIDKSFPEEDDDIYTCSKADKLLEFIVKKLNL